MTLSRYVRSRIREEGVTPACSRKSLVRDNIADSDELWQPLLCMVRYRAFFRKVSHYRVSLLRDLVDELSDGAECNFRNCPVVYFRAIWFWPNFDEKRQRAQQNAHTSA